MARYLRVEYPGAIYHVTVRMVGVKNDSHSLLFLDDTDRTRFIETMIKRSEQYDIRLYCFCLMSNHFHILLETPAANLGRFMQRITTAYAVYYNFRHQRHGHLTQGRYGAKLIEGDNYLLSLSRYIHLNPIQIKSVKNLPVTEKQQYLRKYLWSSYRSYVGLEKPMKGISYEPLLEEFEGKRAERRKRYRQFVEKKMAEEDEDLQTAIKASALCIGCESFRDQVKEKYLDLARQYKTGDDVLLRQVVQYLSRKQVLTITAKALNVSVESFQEKRRNSMLRGIAARMLCLYAGLTQRAAAEELTMSSGTAVGQQLKKLESVISDNRRLRKQVEGIELLLKKERKAGNVE